jgi:hypothetical protein
MAVYGARHRPRPVTHARHLDEEPTMQTLPLDDLRAPVADRTRNRGHGRLEVRTLKAVPSATSAFPTSPRSSRPPAGPATCTPRRGGGRP